MLAFALAAALASTPSRLPPIDQCKSDRSFVAFRRDLSDIVAKRDEERLLRIVGEDIHASLGGDVGKQDFIALWGLRKHRKSKIWDELGEAMRLGCSMTNGVAAMPSMEQQAIDRDEFETWIALPGAILRSRPSAKSRPIARLDWHVLTLRGRWDGGKWLKVRLDDGRIGYVRTVMARSPIDYRAWFHKRNGRWIMAGFLAGD